MFAILRTLSNINNNYENNHYIVSTIINGQDEPSPLSSFFTSVISVSITNYIDSLEEKENGQDKFIYLSFSDFDDKSKEIHKECPICIEDFTENLTEKNLVLTDCNHCYHEACLKEWISQHNTCPVCRHDFNS
jgi:Ring finger domain